MAGKACNVVCVVKSLRMQVENHAGKLHGYTHKLVKLEAEY